MKNKLLSIIKIDLVKHNLIFFVGTFVISVFNYLYYPILGRLVSVVEFGEIQATISIFMQLGILLTAFGYVVANITNNSHASASKQNIILLERVTLGLSILVLLALVLLGGQLRSSLQFTSITPLLLVGVLVILNVPSTTRSYVLQGMKKLRDVSISGIIFSIGKLVLTVALIMVGMSVEGAIIGYILAQVATLVYLTVRSKSFFPGLQHSFNLSLKFKGIGGIKKELQFGVVVLFLLAALAILYSFDVVIARLFLSPEAAGEYSGISSIARIIYFATASVAGVLIASVAVKDTRQRSRRVLLGSLGMVGAVGLFILAIFTFLPTESVTVLLGASYAHVSYLLPITGLFMFIASVNNLLVTFQITRRKYETIIPVLVGMIVLVISLLLKHGGVQDLIMGYLVSNLVVFVILALQIARKNKNEKEATVYSPAQL